MSSHYTPAFRERFWSKVDRIDPDGCWLWRAATMYKGYGVVKLGGRTHRAHRVAYELSNGALPEGAHVLHACDRPGCVNPSHIRAGTQKENTADMVSRARTVRGEKHWSAKLTEVDVLNIRALHEQGEGESTMAAEYGVHRRTVRDVTTRTRWKHVTA